MESLGDKVWWIVVVLAAFCMMGVMLWMILRWIKNQKEVKEKIQRAQDRRSKSLQKTEQEVLRFKHKVKVSLFSPN